MKTGYYIIGSRPVKGLKDSEGGYGLYALNWQTGQFELNYDYLEQIALGDKSGELQEVTEEEFNRYVKKLKKERGLQ